MRKIKHAMTTYHMLEGTEEGRRIDEKWLEEQEMKAERSDKQ